MSFNSGSNRACNFKLASRSTNFEITRAISPWIVLHLVQLLLQIIQNNKVYSCPIKKSHIVKTTTYTPIIYDWPFTPLSWTKRIQLRILVRTESNILRNQKQITVTARKVWKVRVLWLSANIAWHCLKNLQIEKDLDAWRRMVSGSGDKV